MCSHSTMNIHTPPPTQISVGIGIGRGGGAGRAGAPPQCISGGGRAPPIF